MTKTKGQNKSGGRSGKIVQITGPAALFGAFADIVTKLVEKIGLPGTVFICIGWFVAKYGTDEQKHEIIDKYVLGKDLWAVAPLASIALLFAIVVSGQYYFCKRQLKVKSDEIDRLSKWKSEHQAGHIDAQLHHSE